MATPVVCDDAVAVLRQEQHLAVPGVGVQWPAVRERHDRALAPVLVVDLVPSLVTMMLDDLLLAVTVLMDLLLSRGGRLAAQDQNPGSNLLAHSPAADPAPRIRDCDRPARLRRGGGRNEPSRVRINPRAFPATTATDSTTDGNADDTTRPSGVKHPGQAPGNQRRKVWISPRRRFCTREAKPGSTSPTETQETEKSRWEGS